MPVFCQRGFACGETARPVIGPAFWVCRAKSGAAFRCAKPPCAVVRFAAMTSSPRTDVLACPAFALLSHSPTALLNIPALVAIRLHFAARNRAYGYRPHLLGLPRKIRRGISLRETTLCGCPLRGHDFVTPHQCFGLPRFRFAQAWPLGQQPGACRRSAPFRCAKPRWPVVAPAGGNVLATPFSLRSNVAPHIPAGSAGVRSFVPRLAPRSHPGASGSGRIGSCCICSG